MKESVRCLNKMCPRSFSYIEGLGLVRDHCCGKVISEITVFLGMGYPRRGLFGFFRTADLGQQYDTVSRVGGNFLFLFDTFILLCITFGVVRSLSSQVGLPWFIPPRGILLCVGPHPKFISGSLLRGLLPALHYGLKALAPGFGGPSI